MRIDSLVSEKRKRRAQRRKYFFAVVAFLAVYFALLGAFWFVVRLPAFQTKEITIRGNSAVPSDDIMSLLEASILRKGHLITAPTNGLGAMLGFNNMLIWPSALPTSTIGILPQLAGLTIEKNYFLHTITVTATEREPFAVWCLASGVAPGAGVPPSLALSNSTSSTPSATSSPATTIPADESCFWFDTHGTIFGRAFDTQGNAIMVIHDYAQSDLTINDKVLPDEFIPNLISIVNVLKQSGLNISQVALNDLSLQEIDVTTVNGPSLHFSLRFSANSDLGVIKKLTGQSGFNKLQYIDFTVQNRAYYK